ncbi:MAG: cation diffusion facilitator family transporter [Neisseriaceae bacterium]|nr:MAG: cation diffusion facilitator family transporter [Neisseriaceae bacterium]
MINKTNSKLLLSVGIASIVVALVLIILKAFTEFKTGSVSVLAGLMDSVADLLSSVINLIGISIGLKPADKNHNYGHAKAEGLSSFIQATFILGSAMLIIFSAVGRLLHPYPIEHTQVAIMVMIITILVTGILSLFQHYAIKRTNSLSLAADTSHYISDLLLNSSIILSLLLVQLGYFSMDAILAIIIGLWMIYLSGKIMRGAFTILMDETLSESEVIKIEQAISLTPGVNGFHDLMTRSDGKTHYIHVHIEVDENLTFRASHDIATNVVVNLNRLFDKPIKAFIHTDPSLTEEVSYYKSLEVY